MRLDVRAYVSVRSAPLPDAALLQIADELFRDLDDREASTEIPAAYGVATMDKPLDIFAFAASGPLVKYGLRVRSRSRPEVTYDVRVWEYPWGLTIHCECMGSGSKQNMCHHKRAVLRRDASILADEQFRRVLEAVHESAGFAAIRKRVEANDEQFRENGLSLSPLKERLKLVKRRFAMELAPTDGAVKRTLWAHDSKEGSVAVDFHEENGCLRVRCHCAEGQDQLMCHHVADLLTLQTVKLLHPSDAAELHRLLTRYESAQDTVEQYLAEREPIYEEMRPFQKQETELNRQLAAIIRPR
jgi:hypothetical protein